MAVPEACLAFRRTTGNLPLTIELSTETLPKELGPNEVLIKIHAVALNFRDVGILHGRYPVESEERGIVGSDCAAEVVAVGPAVRDFGIGDHVAPIFDLNDITGYEDSSLLTLGGNAPGVLREYAVFEARYLVHLPKYLSWEEASTLTCAGVTAWVSLNSPTTLIRKDTSALLQGTGGVSMIALLLCIAAGIKPIITSSSDEKLASVKKLSPEVQGINYKTTPDIAAEVRRITDGKGVDIVINNVGVASIPSDIAALREKAGTISLVGFLGGFTGDWEPSTILGLMPKKAKLQGIGVGSKADYERLNQFLEEKKVSLAPVIDRIFSFKESRAAFDYLYLGKHVGKVIIKL